VSTDEAVAAVDLEYSLAIDDGGTSDDGIYVDALGTGARISLTDELDEIIHYLTAAECTRLAHYLLACAKAATP
jgi:hypothetical protein